MRNSLKLTAILAVLATPVFSAGSDDDKPPKPTATTIECDEGMVFDEKSEKCIDAKDVKESGLNDDQLYELVRELAYDGQYETSLIVLAAFADQNDPRVWNYKGFNARKIGNTEAAFAFYEKALSLDPEYSLARSYYGQGLLKSGDRVGAYKQLQAIKAAGDKNTWAYAALRNAFAGMPSTY